MIKRGWQKFSKVITYMTSQKGFCPICETDVRFIKKGKWLRDQYRCSKCNSIPRFRALIDTIKRFYPNWRELMIHESSPSAGASSKFLKTTCRNYTASQFFADIPRGSFKDGFRSEDLTGLTFKDNTFDLLVTQDVFEHVMEPEKAFKEIARVLKPGGAHIFSMPWYPEIQISRPRAKVEEGKVIHLLDPVYHGNPIDGKGSLVTFDWGQDFVDIIYKSTGMITTIYLQRDKLKGLEAEFLEIFVSRKPV